MIDLKELKQRKEEIKNNIAARNMQVDLEEVITLQEKRAALIQENEDLRMQRNENAKKNER